MAICREEDETGGSQSDDKLGEREPEEDAVRYNGHVVAVTLTQVEATQPLET